MKINLEENGNEISYEMIYWQGLKRRFEKLDLIPKEITEKMENKSSSKKIERENSYWNMLRVWADIKLSISRRKNHIYALTHGIDHYYQFLDERYKNHLKINKDHKQLISRLLEGFIEVFPSGFIPGGTFLFELRTDDGNELYDKLLIIYFTDEEESVFLGDPFISKFDSDRLFSNQETPLLSLQLTVTEIDQQNNELTLAIIKDSYPTDFIVI